MLYSKEQNASPISLQIDVLGYSTALSFSCQCHSSLHLFLRQFAVAVAPLLQSDVSASETQLSAPGAPVVAPVIAVATVTVFMFTV